MFLSAPIILHYLFCCDFRHLNVIPQNVHLSPSVFSIIHKLTGRILQVGNLPLCLLESLLNAAYSGFFKNSFVVSLIVIMSAVTPYSVLFILEISTNRFSRLTVSLAGCFAACVGDGGFEVSFTSVSGVILIAMQDVSLKYFDVLAIGIQKYSGLLKHESRMPRIVILKKVLVFHAVKCCKYHWVSRAPLLRCHPARRTHVTSCF